MAEEFDIREPALFIGIGHVGGKIASDAAKAGGCKHLEIVYEADHFANIDNSLHIARHGWVNPSASKLRALASSQNSGIKTMLKGFKTIFVIANLAGRGGTAIGPLVCRVAKDAGCQVIAITIMPFGFEHDRIFASGIALGRMRDSSDSLIIVDNEAYLQNNPQDSLERCYQALNRAIHDVASHILRNGVAGGRVNVVTTCPTLEEDLETSLEASLAALYPQISKLGSVARSIIHISYSPGCQLSLDRLALLVGRVRSTLSESSTALISTATTRVSGDSKVHLVTSVLGGTVFDGYDPLAQIIPKEKFIDWDELDASPDLSLPIFSIE